MIRSAQRLSARRAMHLARRFVGSLSTRPPSESSIAVARGVLSEAEFGLWSSMPPEDRRHSLAVLRRFDELARSASRAARAGALLHDVGKLDSGLGTLGRVAASVVGPRTDRFRRYCDHEALGAAMLGRIGSAAETIDLVMRRGELAAALQVADDTAMVRSLSAR